MSLRMCNFYVYSHSTQGVDDSLDVTYECRSVALSPSPTFVCTYMCLNTDVTVTARIERLHTATSIVSMATDYAVSALCVSGRPLASTRRQNMSIGTSKLNPKLEIKMAGALIKSVSHSGFRRSRLGFLNFTKPSWWVMVGFLWFYVGSLGIFVGFCEVSVG